MATEKEGVKFSVKLAYNGGRHNATIPLQLCHYLSLKDGDTLTMTGNDGKHGKFIAVWKEE